MILFNKIVKKSITVGFVCRDYELVTQIYKHQITIDCDLKLQRHKVNYY